MGVNRKSMQTTDVGYINRNRQKVVHATGRRGDSNQKLYEIRCLNCNVEYLANGADIHERLCPSCQNGRPSSGRGLDSQKLTSHAVWTVADAKARFSEVLDKAGSEGPQTITRNGKPAAVIVGSDEWDRKTRRKGTLLEFFQSAPEGFADLDLERVRSKPRDIDL